MKRAAARTESMPPRTRTALRRMAGRLLTGLTLTGLTLTGCAAQHRTPPEAPSHRALTSDEQDTLTRAEHVLVEACMRAQGYEGFPLDSPDSPDAQPVPPRPARLAHVLADRSWAAEHGYGIAEQRRSGAGPGSTPASRYAQKLPEPDRRRFLTVLYGKERTGLSARLPSGTVTASDQGCTARARHALYRDLPHWFTGKVIDENLTALTGTRLHAEPAYQAAAARWSACMQTHGVSAASPGALKARLPELLAGDDPAGTTERRIAVTEAECAADSGLAGVVDGLVDPLTEEVRAPYRSDLDTYRRLQLQALPRARAAALR
ncbi:hypothetical protein [Streptomyces sp. NPDC060031]|uniref:hypothetical protein n=1 Tax=Streptomyces sp. NPDC060031 TaxID=3347043 RepID=UPI0036A786C7